MESDSSSDESPILRSHRRSRFRILATAPEGQPGGPVSIGSADRNDDNDEATPA